MIASGDILLVEKFSHMPYHFINGDIGVQRFTNLGVFPSCSISPHSVIPSEEGTQEAIETKWFFNAKVEVHKTA